MFSLKDKKADDFEKEEKKKERKEEAQVKAQEPKRPRGRPRKNPLPEDEPATKDVPAIMDQPAPKRPAAATANSGPSKKPKVHDGSAESIARTQKAMEALKELHKTMKNVSGFELPAVATFDRKCLVYIVGNVSCF